MQVEGHSERTQREVHLCFFGVCYSCPFSDSTHLYHNLPLFRCSKSLIFGIQSLNQIDDDDDEDDVNDVDVDDDEDDVDDDDDDS